MNHHFDLSAKVGGLQLQGKAEFGNEIIVVSGENGAGKTSLLRCLAGLQTAQGSMMFKQEVWLDSSANYVLLSRFRGVGCVWTDPALLPWLRVEENIKVAATQVDELWCKPWFEAFEIQALMQRKPHMLSTGEAQRVALVRAICSKPKLLLLDEPFSAQAPAIRQRLRLALQDVQRKLDIPVIMISHDAEDAGYLAQQHWHMRQGRLLSEKTNVSRNKVVSV